MTVNDKRLINLRKNKTAAIGFVCLALVQFLWLCPIIRQIGFYLDDWSMMSNLFFGPKSLYELTLYCLNDPKVLIRPVEGPYFAILYFLFGYKPFAYHVVNALCELFAAWFLYLAINRLTNTASLSLSAALIFLLLPSHDCTHYWFTASSVTLSLALYLFSLWSNIKAAQEKKAIYFYLAAFSFALCLFNYESFLPFAAVNFVCCLIYLNPNLPLPKRILKSILYILPLVIIALFYYYYQRIYLIQIGKGYYQSMAINWQHFLSVLYRGFEVNLSPHFFSFVFDRAKEAWQEPLSIWWFGTLILIALICFSCLNILNSIEKTGEMSNRHIFKLMTLGLTTIFFSYTIFGFASDYMPGLNTIINRINTGASIGTTLVLVALVYLIGKFLLPTRRYFIARNYLIQTCLAFVIAFFVLANWGLSKPWVVSWQVQKNVQYLVKKQGNELKDKDVVILVGTPRYVMWSPVYDGVWDFQSMVRLVLANKNIDAGVVSDRMRVSADSVQDVSMNFVCATYRFKRMFALVPSYQKWIPINSAEKFINIVKTYGMQFGIDDAVLARWQNESHNNLGQ
jgi:hypothetical protein